MPVLKFQTVRVMQLLQLFQAWLQPLLWYYAPTWANNNSNHFSWDFLRVLYWL